MKKVNLEVKKLEHQLIDAKMEAAFLKSTVEEKENKLKKQ